MMNIPETIGLSNRRLEALHEDCLARSRAGLTGKWLKAFDALNPAPAAQEPAQRGPRPKRKRARRQGERARLRETSDFPVTDQAIRAINTLFEKKVVPRTLAQQARAAGKPHARPRDYY